MARTGHGGRAAPRYRATPGRRTTAGHRATPGRCTRRHTACRAPGHRACLRARLAEQVTPGGLQPFNPSTTPTYNLWNRCGGVPLPLGAKCINAGVFHRLQALLPSHLSARPGLARLSREVATRSGSSGAPARYRRVRGPAAYPHSTRKLPRILQGPARPLCAGSTRDPQVKAPMLRL